MVDETPQTSSTAGDTGSTGTPSSTIGQTVEEVEASWQHRFSQRDLAHNAEVASLKAQNEALRSAPPPAPAGETPEAAELRELRAQLAASEQARMAETLRSRYPTVVSVLNETAGMLPEEKIAALEAMVDQGNPNPIIDANAARRQLGVQSETPLKEKSKEELLGDLRRLAPAFQQAAKEGLL